MRSAIAARCAAVVLLAGASALAQQAGPPTEMKSPADPTSQRRPTDAVPAAKPAPETTAPVDPDKSSAAQPSATPAEGAVPSTTIFPEADVKTVLAPKLDPGPLPKNKSALIGGVVKDIDQIRNRMTVEIYGKGGGKMKLLFDPRTHFVRDGADANQMAVKKGDQVYVDTQLVNRKIFARDVYVRTAAGVADASGQIDSFDPGSRELKLNDRMSESQVKIRLSPSTVIRTRNGNGTLADLQPDALIAVKMSPAGKNRNVAQEIEVIAQPGAQFTFYGTLTHLDLSSGLLAVDNKSDHKLYDIVFVPSQFAVNSDWKVGSEVAINATFNGRNYTAKTLTVTPPPQVANPE